MYEYVGIDLRDETELLKIDKKVEIKIKGTCFWYWVYFVSLLLFFFIVFLIGDVTELLVLLILVVVSKQSL